MPNVFIGELGEELTEDSSGTGFSGLMYGMIAGSAVKA